MNATSFPGLFPQKMGGPHPLYEGKALGSDEVEMKKLSRSFYYNKGASDQQRRRWHQRERSPQCRRFLRARECFARESAMLTTIWPAQNTPALQANENGKTAIGLDWQNSNSARATRVLYPSLPSLFDYDVKLPSRFVEDVNTRQLLSFFFLNSEQSSRIQLHKKSSSIWRPVRDGKGAKKFEAARLHF